MSTKNDRKQASVTARVLAPKRRTALTWQEEVVVRMTRGVSESEDFVLEFRGQERPDVQARLALIEGEALLALGLLEVSSEADAPVVDEPSIEVDRDLKARILRKLSGSNSDD